MTTIITTKQNKTYKYLKRLMTDSRFARKENVFAIETDKLIGEVLERSDVEILYFVKSKNTYHYDLCENEIEVTSDLFKELSNLSLEIEEILFVRFTNKVINKNDNLLVLDHIQDPGNIGATLRSANAFGFTNVILINCANIYNPKTIRSAKGSLFDLNIESFNHEEACNYLRINNYFVLTTHLNGENASDIKISDKYALVLGNEGFGISDEIMGISNKNIKIKTENVDSLNVSIAASIIMYELGKE